MAWYLSHSAHTCATTGCCWQSMLQLLWQGLTWQLSTNWCGLHRHFLRADRLKVWMIRLWPCRAKM